MKTNKFIVLIIIMVTGINTINAQESLSESGKPELVLPMGHVEPVIDIAFNSDYSLVLSSGTDKSILWDLKSGKPIRHFPIKNTNDNCSAFCTAYQHVVGKINGREFSWNIKNGKNEKCLHGMQNTVVPNIMEKSITLGEKTKNISSPSSKYRCEFSFFKIKIFDNNNKYLKGLKLKNGKFEPLAASDEAEEKKQGTDMTNNFSDGLKKGVDLWIMNNKGNKTNKDSLKIKSKKQEQEASMDKFADQFTTNAKQNLDPRIKKIVSIQISPDDNYLLVDFNKGFPQLLSITDFKIIREYKPKFYNVKDSLFSTKSIISPDNKWVVSFYNGTMISSGSHDGYLFDLNTGTQIKEFAASVKQQPNVDVSNNGKTLMISGMAADYSSGVTMSGGENRLFYKTDESKFYSNQYNDDFLIERVKDIDKKYIISSNNRGLISFWDSFTGDKPGLKKEMLPDSGKTANTIFYDDKNKMVEILFNNGNYVLYDAVNNKIISSEKLQANAGSKGYLARYFVLSANRRYIGFDVDHDNTVYIYDKEKKEIVFSHQFGAMMNHEEHIRFNHNNNGVWVWNTNSTFYYEDFLKKETMKNQGAGSSGDILKMMVPAQDTNLLCIKRSNSVTVLDLVARGEKETLEIEGDPEYCDFGNDKIITSGAGQINFYSISQRKKLFSLILVGTNDFMFLLPDFKYYGTKAAAEQLSFVQELKVYSFDQFDIKNNRPDLVLAALRPNDKTLISKLEKAYKNRLKRSGIKEEMFKDDWNIPETIIQNYSELMRIDSTTANTITIKAEFKDSKNALLKAMVWVNGVPLNGKKGFALSGPTASMEIPVPLSTGSNKIIVSCINQSYGESYRQQFSIKYTPKVKTKKKLYIITVGVNIDAIDKNNKSDILPLKYTNKDGRDFVNLFKSRKINSMYDQVKVDSLFEDYATRKNILNLRSKLDSSSVDDEVVVLFSGHGEVNDKLNEFFFINYDIDRQNPQYENGLSFADIDALFDGLPARKRIIFLDACYSGEIDPDKTVISTGDSIKNNNSNKPERNIKSSGNPDNFPAEIEYMKRIFDDVSLNSGTIVLSAASSTSKAQELPQYQNGALTKAVLLGLQKMESDIPVKDGAIMVSELKKYLPSKVAQLSENSNKQSTIRQDSNYNNWRIW